jgi:hypothetical protein
MKKIFRYRQRVTIHTTSGHIVDREGPWHYRYIDEDIAAIRSAESVTTYDDFETMLRTCYLWPDCTAGTTYFRKRKYISVWDSWGGYKYFEKDVTSATWFSEYQPVSNSITFQELKESLPASEFIEYCLDTGLTIFSEDWSGHI